MKTMKSWFGKYKGAENKHSRQIYFIFAGILILIWIFYYILCYYQMPVGDDLLAPFYMGFQHYVDAIEWKPSVRVETIEMAVKQWIQYYLTFNGRITSLFQGYLFNKLGECGTAIVSSTIYTATILLICRIGLNSWKKVLKCPVWLLLCSIYMYQLTPTGTYIQMWTFVCQYATSTFLILIYYLLIIDTYEKDNITNKRIIGMFMLGIFSGASHECLAVFAILLVSIKGVILSCFMKKMNPKRILINSGLYLGFLITFFAPGNFVRLLSGHDIARYSETIGSKLSISIYEHLVAAGVLTRREIWMVLLFAVAIILTCKKREFHVIDYIQNNLEILIVVFLSIPVWAVFAPPVPQYGLQLWKACLIILMLRAINTNILKELYWKIISISCLTIWLISNMGWMTDMIHVTVERREEIKYGVDNGISSIYVKRYPESTNNYLTLYNYANQDLFDVDYAEAYYGIKIYIEQ